MKGSLSIKSSSFHLSYVEGLNIQSLSSKLAFQHLELKLDFQHLELEL